MINEICFLITLFVCLAGTYILYRFFGRNGLYAWIALAVIMGNVGALGMADMFTLPATLGCAVFGTVYLATDILNEMYGEKDAKRAVWAGFICTIFFVLIGQSFLLFTPSESDFARDSFDVIFGLIPRICLGSIVAYVVGNLLDVKLYTWLKKRHDGRYMWFRNNACTILVQLFDNFILLGIGYGGIMEWETIFWMSITAWIIEVIVALLDTPFLYLAKSHGPKETEG